MNNTESPDVFPAGPSTVETRRLGKKPVLLLFVAFLLVTAALMYTAYKRGQPSASGSSSDHVINPVNADRVTRNAPRAGAIEAERDPPPPVPRERSASPSERHVPSEAPPTDAGVYAQAWEAWRQRQDRVDQDRLADAMSALKAAPSVSGFGNHAAQGAGQGGTRAQPGALPAGFPGMPAMPDLSGELSAAIAAAGLGGQAGGANADDNNAAGKAQWLASDRNSAWRLPAVREASLSPYEIKTGTVIPGVMISGVNSDLPGQLVAQVRENVYDSATGQFLLIPQGTRIVGTYDNQITRGQSRVLVAWQRLIFPGGDTLDIGSMPGADQAGYGGFRDRVRNHYWKVFGNAMMMSLFSAGVQLSQPDGGDQERYSSQEIMAAAMGQQLGQAGLAMIQRNLNIQPTLEIRPGYRFNVMVTKDIMLEPQS